MSRHTLTGRAWTRIEPLLPKRRMGRSPEDPRIILGALLWLGKAGVPWRDLPEWHGPRRTVVTRFSTAGPVGAVGAHPHRVSVHGGRAGRYRSASAHG